MEFLIGYDLLLHERFATYRTDVVVKSQFVTSAGGIIAKTLATFPACKSAIWMSA